MSDKWTKPLEIDGLTSAFGVRLEQMPSMQEIPAEFKNPNNRDKWRRFISDWFFCGLKNLEIQPKKGIDKMNALRHIGAILKSFEPQHEHKEAAAAYLSSLWFDDAKWERAKP